MLKPRVFITRTILEQGLQLVKDFCQADIWSHELPPNHEELLLHVSGKDGLLCLLTDQIDEEVMDAAGPKLKVISNCAVGVDNVDLHAATIRKIPVGNTPNVLTEATADFTFALMMAAARRVVEGERQVRSGAWKTWSLGSLLGADFTGATLGIIGFGRIGQAVARRATGFGMRILFTDPNPPRIPLTISINSVKLPIEATRVKLEILLSESDFITIHTPLTDKTRDMMNSAAFSKMKSNAVLVNTSRGAVVNQEALFEALDSGRIFAAGLDVTVPEPLPTDNPLLKLDNCLIVPHIASASWQTRKNMSRMAAENLIAGLNGERLPYCVNSEVYQNL